MADGANLQQALAVAETPADLLALETEFAVGSYLRTSDGHCYKVLASDGDLITAGFQQLRILPDRAGEYHFEAAAPGYSMEGARNWMWVLPPGAVLNISGSYTLDMTLMIPTKVTVKGPGKLTLPADAAFTAVELQADESEWYVELDGNRANVTSGTPNALYLNNIKGAKVGAKISNASGSGIFATGCTHLTVLHSAVITGCGHSGVQVTNGSDYFTIEDGARISENDNDNILVTDGGGAPCNYVKIGAVIADGAGQGSSGYWCGVRLRFVDGFEIAGVRATRCLGAGVAVQASSSSPQTQYSRNGTISRCMCHANNDGIIVDDNCRYVATSANQCNDNMNDGIDINDARYCKSLGDTCLRNGQQGILLWGSQNCDVHKATCLNNNQSNVDANASGIYVQTNATTGGIPSNNKITRCVCGDDQAIRTQTFGIRLVSGTGHRLEDNDVSGNKTGGINDSTGSPAQNPKLRNLGYKTETTCWAVIPAGSTSVVVGSGTTGLVGTGVTIQYATAVPIGPFSRYSGHTLSAFGTQSFSINLGEALATDLTFNCTASVFGDGVGM